MKGKTISAFPFEREPFTANIEKAYGGGKK